MGFGVTEHLERSYGWLNTNKGCDKNGLYASQPYDGNDRDYVDFYFPPHEDSNLAYSKDAPDWRHEQWPLRIRDLVDEYEPDLLYTGGGIPP